MTRINKKTTLKYIQKHRVLLKVRQQKVNLSTFYGYPLSPLKFKDPLGLTSKRVDGHPWGYGCGDEDSDLYVPDGLAGADFMPACRKHDSCYETLGQDKKYCDAQLGKNITLACDIASKRTIADTDNGLAICYIAAGIYEYVVDTRGRPAFDAAQIAAKNRKEN